MKVLSVANGNSRSEKYFALSPDSDFMRRNIN